MPKAKRICLVVESPLDPPFGGIPRIAYRQGLGLVKNGWDVHVLAPESPIGATMGLHEKGFTLDEIPGPSIHFAREAAKCASSLVQDSGVSIVMAYGNAGLHLAKVVARSRTPCKFVLSVQHSVLGETVALLDHFALRFDGLKRNGSRALSVIDEARVLRGSVDRFIVPTQFVGQELSRLYRIDASRISIVPDGIEPTETHPAVRHADSSPESNTSGSVAALYVGAIEARKGVHCLLRAFAAASKSCPRMELLIIGAGPATKHMLSLSQRLDIAKRIRWCGRVSDQEVRSLLRDASLVVIPSLYEGFGLVLLEAMAAGKRTIASSIPPFLEIAGDRTGVTFVTSGDVDSLRRALCASYSEIESGATSVPDYTKTLVRFAWPTSARVLSDTLETIL